jgi:hypothetical protein
MRRRLFIAIAALLIVVIGTAWILLRPSGSPALAIHFSHYETNSGHIFAVLTITNGGTGPASYSSASFGSSSPFYQLMVLTPDGWTNHSPMFCGTEAHPRRLKPGGSSTLHVMITTNLPWKVGFNYAAGNVNDTIGHFAPRVWQKWIRPISSATRPTFGVWSDPIETAGGK